MKPPDPTPQTAPTAQLGDRLMPRHGEYLPEALVLGVYFFFLGRDVLWATLGVCILGGTLVILTGQMRRRRRGVVAHERYRLQDALGWGLAGLMTALFLILFLTSIFLDELHWPTWALLVLSAAIAGGLYWGLQRWTRARARLIASPEGGQQHERIVGTSRAPTGALDDPADLELCDLLSRTQMMRLDALTHDLGRPEAEVRGRVGALARRGLVKPQAPWRAPHERTGWVYLTFRGEEELTAHMTAGARQEPDT